jgi:hypothetical protein
MGIFTDHRIEDQSWQGKNDKIINSIKYTVQHSRRLYNAKHTNMPMMRYLRPLCKNSVLTHEDQSGGRSAGTNANCYFNLSHYVVFTYTQLFVSFIDRHLSMLIMASYIQPRQDKLHAREECCRNELQFKKWRSNTRISKDVACECNNKTQWVHQCKIQKQW